MDEKMKKGKTIVDPTDSGATEACEPQTSPPCPSPKIGTIIVKVTDIDVTGAADTGPPIDKARVSVHATTAIVQNQETDVNGVCRFDVYPGSYCITVDAFGQARSKEIVVEQGATHTVSVCIPVGANIELMLKNADCTFTPCTDFPAGRPIMVRLMHQLTDTQRKSNPVTFSLNASRGTLIMSADSEKREGYLETVALRGEVRFTATIREIGSAAVTVSRSATITPPDVQTVDGGVTVSMRRANLAPTDDLPLWVVIRKSTEATSFDNYLRFMDHVLCGKPLSPEFSDYERAKVVDHKIPRFDALQGKRFLPFNDADAYRILKVATEAFLVVNCAVALDTFPFSPEDLAYLVRRDLNSRSSDLSTLWSNYLEFVNGSSDVTLPYLAFIHRKLQDVRINNPLFDDADPPEECFGILRNKLTEPCLLELIWSYWHEEGMLVQTMNAISRRFQNIRTPDGNDPLANLEIDPLRPLNNLIWGYLQDEQHRLSVVRRTYEYDHHYGMRLFGKAIPEVKTADSRSKFLEAFHNLLHLCTIFFQQDDDTTVVADGFPVLNALKEVHLILTQGAHNQFGDLPSTARQEMLVQQWILARPEFREFLPTRIMVAYPEPWMDRVDAMKKLKMWTDVNVLHFRNLGVFGEQILLSVRFGAWAAVNDPAQAANWLRFWRPEIQGYIHAYRATTGVDLTSDTVDSTLPAVHLRARLARQLREVGV